MTSFISSRRGQSGQTYVGLIFRKKRIHSETIFLKSVEKPVLKPILMGRWANQSTTCATGCRELSYQVTNVARAVPSPSAVSCAAMWPWVGLR